MIYICKNFDLTDNVGAKFGHCTYLNRFKKKNQVTHPLFSDGLKVPLRLLLLDSTGGLGFTVGAALGNGTLPSSSPHAHAVDHVTYRQGYIELPTTLYSSSA